MALAGVDPDLHEVFAAVVRVDYATDARAVGFTPVGLYRYLEQLQDLLVTEHD
jgi:hypothetical protein